MSGKRLYTVLLLIPVLLGLGAWWGLSKPEATDSVGTAQAQTVSAPKAAPSAASQTPPQKTPDGTRAWIPGALFRYEMSAEQKLAFAPAKPGASVPPGMLFVVKGEWNVGVSSVTDKLIHLRVQLKPSLVDVTMESEKSVAPQVREMLSRALVLPFFISVDKTGLVKATHFEKSTDTLARGLLRSLVANSQFVVAGVPGNSWQTEEFDTTGLYLALYQRQGDGRFEKKKQSYTHVTTATGPQPVASHLRIDVSSSATFELEADLWSRTFQSSERLVVDGSEAMPTTTYSLSMRMHLLERLRDPSLLGSFEASQARLGSAAMSAFQGVDQDPMDEYRQTLGSKNFDSLLKELHALPKDEHERDEVRTNVLDQLHALFMLHPAEALKVPDAIRAGMDPLAASPMIGALSAASSREAIQSMVELSKDGTLSQDIRMDAVGALGMAETPNSEGVDALRNLSRDTDPMLRDTATLALGNAAFRMSGENKNGTQGLIHELGTMYRTGSSPEVQMQAIRALGNTREPLALPTIQEALRSPIAELRVVAIEALRNIPDPTADRLLSEHLVKDPAAEVRRAAIFSASFRSLGPLLPALEHAQRSDLADGVRSDVIHLMGELRGSLPQAMPLLFWSSANDPNPELRKIAQQFIDASASPTP